MSQDNADRERALDAALVAFQQRFRPWVGNTRAALAAAIEEFQAVMSPGTPRLRQCRCGLTPMAVCIRCDDRTQRWSFTCIPCGVTPPPATSQGDAIQAWNSLMLAGAEEAGNA